MAMIMLRSRCNASDISNETLSDTPRAVGAHKQNVTKLREDGRNKPPTATAAKQAELRSAHLLGEVLAGELERVGQRTRGGQLDGIVRLLLVHALGDGVEDDGGLRLQELGALCAIATAAA